MNFLLETKQLMLQREQLILCRDLTLQIRPGEIWGILGPNGSGKTTLLHKLAGLLPAIQDEIYLQGKNIRFLSRQQIAQVLGILFQDYHDIFPQTVWDICRNGRYCHPSAHNDDDIIKKALTDMGLHDKKNQFIQTLSGGERKRLNIATLLTQQPLIYLLDEPTNHLDFHYQVKTLNLFRNIVKNKSASILMSLHDINIAAHYCQKIILLGHGEYKMGETHQILEKDILSYFYEHPIQQIQNRWFPDFVE
jgi:iron complex transport system ATP-binding protein